jgi:hypothetical protein
MASGQPRADHGATDVSINPCADAADAMRIYAGRMLQLVGYAFRTGLASAG